MIMLVALCGCLLLSTWVAGQQTGDIQLAHGTTNTGVIQLYHTDSWMSLCAWLFTDTEATVACQQLGYLQGRALPPGAFGDLSGDGSYPEILRRCQSGQEARLVDCDFDEVAECSVQGVGYASVHCFNETPAQPDNTVRLDAEPAYFTTVSVYASDMWGRVCTTFWDDSDADVICRQFGYHGGIATFLAGDATVPFLLSEINCVGNETSLSDCPTTANVCDNDRSAAVVCYQNEGQAPTFSMVGGHSDRYGKVVFSVDGQKGLVCKSALNWQEAYPLCKTMGFTSGSVLNEDLEITDVDNVVLDNISCEGQEGSVYQCTVPAWNQSTPQCQGQQMGLVLYCYNSVRLHNGLPVETEAYHLGRVEIRDDDRWYAVCADSFNEVAATVTCRELGYPMAQILTPDSFGNRYTGDSQHVASLACFGTEASLSECSYTIGRCSMSSKHAALLCTQQGANPNTSMTLSSSYYGNIVATMYGVEGTVCMEGWDDTEATIACKAAGHTTGVVLAGATTLNRFKPVWAFNFECMGDKDRLKDCSYETTFNPRDWTCADNLTPAGVLCFNSTPPDPMVRIVDGRNDWEGRVEVYTGDSTWGTICNSGWSVSDARVVCRELGYADGQPHTSGFSQADDTVETVLANVNCDGDERSLLRCASSGWKRVFSSCASHTKDAGVFCYRTITLDPTSTYGAVQYHDGDKHGLVCADSFAANAAKVVCRELDPSYSYSIPLCCSAFGPKQLEIAMSGLRCDGRENSLTECIHSTVDLTCSSGHYASVVCSQHNFGFNKITATPIVKVNYFLHEGYVCTEEFTDADATVLCKQDGKLKGYAYKEDAAGLENNIRWLRGLNCVGTETTFENCGTPNWGHIGMCSWDAVAAVMCATTEEDMKFDIRLESGTSTVGRLEVYIQSQWGSVCGTHLTKSEAVVVCRQLGYHDGITMAPGSYGSGTGEVLLSGVKCQGNESSIKDCVWSGYGSPSQLCDHSKDAAIRCYSNVRLTGSTTVNYGRLEVYDDVESDWVAVCDRSQVVTNANLLCRQLGYVAGMFQKGSPLGPTTRKITIVSMTCSTQDDCTFNRGICASEKYMGLYCSESIIVQESVNIRLPENSFYGPVSIQRFGLWGHMCSVGFDDKDAQVICLQLGYASGMALKTYKTEGFPIIQGNVQCQGDETIVASCDRTSFSEGHNCYDVDTVAAVMCYDVDGVTLGSTDMDHNLGQMQSYAEVVANGQHLRINMVKFEDVDAAVYCQALDFAGGDAFRRGNGAYGVAELSCMGSEETILQCPAVWDPSKTKDQQGELAGVTCYTSVRLLEGNPARYGAVYTSVGVESGPVCAEGFDDADANVACRNLGHESGLSLCCSPFGLLDDPGILTNVQCQGNEAQFTDCLHDNVSASDAEACRRDYAAVVCFSGAKPTDYTLRIEGSSGYSGSLIVRYLDVDGSVCIDGWDDDDAHVACRQLGFNRGVAYRATRSDSPSPFWTSELDCDGSEAQLSECSMTELGKVTECRNMLSHAGVICFNNEGIFYRLGGSRENRYGRVEVSVNGEWNSLCNLHWENQDSQVLCKMLGFRTGEAYSGVLQDTFSGPVWEANFLCDGSEETLHECVSSGWRKSTVSACAFHQNDAAAFCYRSVKLSTGVGRTTDQGAVLFYYNNGWHTICNKGFTQVSAQVVCRELGFIDGQVLSGTSFGALLEYPRLTSHTVRCRGDETDVTDCLVEEPCNAQNYISVVCYGFILTTTAVPTKVEKSFDPVPVIIAVVLFVVVIIIGAIVLYCLSKRRKNRKLERSKEAFDNTILSENVDGTVEVSNRLHGLVDTPETSRVYYSNRNEDVAVQRQYDNPAYNRRNLDRSESDAHKSVIQVGPSDGYEHPYDKIRSSQSQSTRDPSHPYDNLHQNHLQREMAREVQHREDSVEKDDAEPDMFISPFASSGVLESPTDSHPEPSWKTDGSSAQ